MGNAVDGSGDRKGRFPRRRAGGCGCGVGVTPPPPPPPQPASSRPAASTSTAVSSTGRSRRGSGKKKSASIASNTRASSARGHRVPGLPGAPGSTIPAAVVFTVTVTACEAPAARLNVADDTAHVACAGTPVAAHRDSVAESVYAAVDQRVACRLARRDRLGQAAAGGQRGRHVGNRHRKRQRMLVASAGSRDIELEGVVRLRRQRVQSAHRERRALAGRHAGRSELAVRPVRQSSAAQRDVAAKLVHGGRLNGEVHRVRSNFVILTGGRRRKVEVADGNRDRGCQRSGAITRQDVGDKSAHRLAAEAAEGHLGGTSRGHRGRAE